MANGLTPEDLRLIQATSAIGSTALQAQQQKKQLLLQNIKQVFDKANSQFQTTIKLLGDPNIPDEGKVSMYNQLDSYSSILYGSRDVVDPQTGTTSKQPVAQFGQITEWMPEFNKLASGFSKFMNSPDYSTEVKRTVMPVFMEAVRSKLSPAQIAKFEEAIVQPTLSRQFGTGTPVTVQQGLQEQQVRITPTGQAVPITMAGQAGAGQPLMQPSKEAIDRSTQFRKEFNNDEVVKGLRKARADANRINELIDADIPGSAGPIITQRAKASGEQRITDADVDRFAGSKAIAASVKRVLERARTGKLTKEDQQHFKAFNDIVSKKVDEQLNNRLDAFIKSITPQLPGVDQAQLRQMIGGLTLTQEGETVPLQELTPESDLSNLSDEELQRIIDGEF